MPETITAQDRLNGWGTIAKYLKCDVGTAIRWAKTRGLPFYQPGGPGGVVHASRLELDAWQRGRAGNGTQSNGVGTIAVVAAEPDRDPSAECEAGTAAVSAAPKIVRKSLYLAIWISAVAVVVTALATLLWTKFFAGFRNEGETTLLSSDSPIESLIAGNGNVYFGQWQGGSIALMAAPDSGGAAARQIPTPFLKNEPVAVDPQGKYLLVLAGNGEEKERPLWRVPLDGSSPERIGQFVCQAASLSPDGRLVAFASRGSIYLTAPTGASPHLLHTFSDVPQILQWSLDGRRIVALVADPSKNATVWMLTLDGQRALTLLSMAPLTTAAAPFDSLSPVIDGADSVFVGAGEPRPTVYSLQNAPMRWVTAPKLTRFSQGEALWNSHFAIDRPDHRLFSLRSTPERTEMQWLDPKTSSVRPFLPGVSASYVDFSSNGRHLAFVTAPRTSLWIADEDGSHAAQIDTNGMTDIELPRWSPDGRTLAFMGKYPGRPYRIFLVSSSGARPREASLGNDNQGAPTWSPNGRNLVYGRVLCQEENSCAIVQIDLKSGQEMMVPGSEGLSTARWSPNGRYVAALRPDLQQVVLFDGQKRAWRKVADGINGNDLAWSQDSRVLYASKPVGIQPQIVRIPIDGSRQTLLDLSPFSRLFGRVGPWFTVTPGGEIVFERLVAGSEIVAFKYARR